MRMRSAATLHRILVDRLGGNFGKVFKNLHGIPGSSEGNERSPYLDGRLTRSKKITISRPTRE